MCPPDGKPRSSFLLRSLPLECLTSLERNIYLSPRAFSLLSISLHYSPSSLSCLSWRQNNPRPPFFTDFTDNGANYPTIVWTVFVGQVNAMFTVLGEFCFRPARSIF